ncbi:hypothetical protein JCM3765_000729 [Sporobolomyces pararoseus]
MGFLPPLGTTYSSFDALKLDVLERALSRNLNFRTYSSQTDKHIDFRCSARTTEDKVCHCRVYGSKQRSGFVRVTGKDEEHTCSEEKRHYLPQGMLHPRAKIQDLKRKVSAREQERMKLRREKEQKERRRNSHERALSDESEEENSVLVGKTSDRLLSTRAGKGKSRSRSEDSEEENEISSEAEEDDDELQSSVQDDSNTPSRHPNSIGTRLTPSLEQEEVGTIYPNARSVPKEIDCLIAAGPVDCPDLSETFDSARQLLVRLHSYAQQHQFRLNRESKHDELNRLEVRCTRYRATSKKAQNFSRCPCKILAYRDKAEKWRIKTIVKEHNHPTLDNALPEKRIEVSPLVSVPRKRARQNPPSPPPPPSPSPSARITPTSLDCNSLTPALPPRPISIASHSHPLSTSTKSTFGSTSFSSLIQSFSSCPTQTSTFLTSLSAVGISDVETLSSILKLETTNFQRFLSGFSSNVASLKLESSTLSAAIRGATSKLSDLCDFGSNLSKGPPPSSSPSPFSLLSPPLLSSTLAQLASSSVTNLDQASPRSSKSRMGFLPQIGSTYSSIAALKLDVLERGLSKGFKFATKHSARDSSIGLYCSVNAPNGDYCSCRLRDQLATIGSSDLKESTTEEGEGEGEGNGIGQNIEGDGQKLERRLGNNDVWQLYDENLDYYNIQNEPFNGVQSVQDQHYSLDSVHQLEVPNLSCKRSLQPSTPSRSSPNDFYDPSYRQKSPGSYLLDRPLLPTSSTSSDHLKSLPSFVRSFLSTPSKLPPHLDTLKALGIEDTDTLISTLLMGPANWDRLLDEIENEETRSLIFEMARDFTLNL